MSPLCCWCLVAATLLFITDACCTALALVSSDWRLWTSCHWTFESTSSIEPDDFRWPEKLRARLLLSLSDPDSPRRCLDRWCRCFRCELCDRPEPRDSSLSLSDCRRRRCLDIVQKGLAEIQTNTIVCSYFRHDLESFEDWLSTELERKRCVVGRIVEFFRVVADRTDRGLAVTPKSPFCCVRDHGALRVLLGESGAPLLRPLLVPYASGYWRNDNVVGTMHVDRYGLSNLSLWNFRTRHKRVVSVFSYTWAGWGIEIDLVSNLFPFCIPAEDLLFSSSSSKDLRGCRRDGVRLKLGGDRPCARASRTACFSVRPLQK